MKSEMVFSSPFFEGLQPEEIEKIVRAGVRKVTPRGGFIFHQGELAEAGYLLTSGLVRLVQTTPAGKTILLRFFLPGDLIGGIAAVRAHVFPASAIAVKRTETLSWDREMIAWLMRSYPRLVQNALRILEDRFYDLQERYRNLATERVEQRLAQILVQLQSQAGVADSTGITIGIPLSREDLAEMAGTTLYSVSRVLAAWERAGVVRLGRLCVTIKDPARLRTLAESK